MNATMAVCALFLVATLGGCSSLRSPTFPSPETRKGVHVKVDGLYRAGMGEPTHLRWTGGIYQRRLASNCSGLT